MRVRIRVPATSANLGPGFDVLGLALALHNEMAFEEFDGVSVSIEGEGAGRLETGGDNVVVRGARMAFEAAGRPWKGVRLHCVNRIPPSRGLGSSAAAWVGGLVGGNALCGAPLARDVRFTTGLGQLGSLILRMEPLGARQLPTQNLLNFRIEKKQQIRN